MVDETVVVALLNSRNLPVALHTYGCDSPFSEVQILTTTGVACTPTGGSKRFTASKPAANLANPEPCPACWGRSFGADYVRQVTESERGRLVLRHGRERPYAAFFFAR
jgi:hypothetical protein